MPLKYLLIIDDNLKNLETTARILMEEGYMITLAQDGHTALKSLEEQMPDLILLDIMMPVMDGFEVCRLIKENPKYTEIPVIFLSAKSQTEDLAEGFNAGGVDYITKPFRREELLIRVKNHLELAGSRKKIIEMNKSRDRLYSIIAHDIRSPLSAISFTIDAIANGYVDPCGEKFPVIVKQLDKLTNETQSLLENLLTWTKMSSEAVKIFPELHTINSIVDKCMGLFERSLNDKKISVTLETDGSHTAWFDEVTIHAVIRNLISNAVKFTPEGGSVCISSHPKDGFMGVSVQNSGEGMSKDAYNKIFNENESVTTTGTSNEKGSGLGYIIIKDFTKINKGRLEVQSSPSAGTKVTVYLPLKEII